MQVWSKRHTATRVAVARKTSMNKVARAEEYIAALDKVPKKRLRELRKI